MVQEQSRKYELQGLKTRGGQPIILGARGNEVTSGRGAPRDDGAEQWRRGGADLRYFPKRRKQWNPTGKMLEPTEKTLEPKMTCTTAGFHLILLIEAIEENYF